MAEAGVNAFLGVQFILVFGIEEGLRVLVPRPEVVLVENDKVPVFFAHPFVLGFNSPGSSTAQEILE